MPHHGRNVHGPQGVALRGRGQAGEAEGRKRGWWHVLEIAGGTGVRYVRDSGPSPPRRLLTSRAKSMSAPASSKASAASRQLVVAGAKQRGGEVLQGGGRGAAHSQAA